MAIHHLTRLALKALSYPDLQVKKLYPLERTMRAIPAPAHQAAWRPWDRKVLDGEREILVRLYKPPRGQARHTLLFFHGGGWVFESVDTYNSVCRDLARGTQCNVISVEYRLAPENRFPDGLHDCYAAARELFLDPGGVYLPPRDVTLIGDSAGANLAAAVSLMARDRGEFRVPRQILIYPATYWDHSQSSPFPSVHENGTDYLLTSKRICDYMDLYRRSDEDLHNPYFAPLEARDFSRQPDTLIITAEYDPLRDEGEEYGRRLQAAGNRVQIHRMPDALHGFFSLGPRYVHVKRAHALINQFLSGDDTPCGKA